MWKFKDSTTVLNVEGIGVVNSNNLNDSLARRLLESNGAFSKYLTQSDGEKAKKGPEKGGGKKGNSKKS